MHPEPIRESVEHARGRLDRMLPGTPGSEQATAAWPEPATVVEAAWL